jgi:hypothetical protein
VGPLRGCPATTNPRPLNLTVFKTVRNRVAEPFCQKCPPLSRSKDVRHHYSPGFPKELGAGVLQPPTGLNDGSEQGIVLASAQHDWHARQTLHPPSENSLEPPHFFSPCQTCINPPSSSGDVQWKTTRSKILWEPLYPWLFPESK